MAKGGAGKASAGKGKAGKDGKAKGKDSSPKKKASPQELMRIEEELSVIFARKRYEEMDAIYKFVSPSTRITILLPNIHVWEEWSALPLIPQLCCSDEEVQPKWRKQKDIKDQLLDPNDVAVEVPFAYYKSCYLRGVVMVKEAQLLAGERVYVEVCARLRYNSNDITDPLQPLLRSCVLDFREYRKLYPIKYDTRFVNPELMERLKDKAKLEMFGVRPLAFEFDLSQRMDSIKFNRPGENTASGIVWECTAYIGRDRHLRNDLDTATIEFCKYTYAPILSPESPLRLSPVESSRRYNTINDPGAIILEGKLPRDLFYHEDYIPVTVNITNASTRLVVSCVMITVEQVIRTYKDSLQEINLLVAEEYFDCSMSQCGLPVTSKNKTWSRTVFLRPMLEAVKDKYNLLIEGRVRTEREYLASSTVLFSPNPTDRDVSFYLLPTVSYIDTSGEKKHKIVTEKIEPFELAPLPGEENDKKDKKKKSPDKSGKASGKAGGKAGGKGGGKAGKDAKGKKNKNTSNVFENDFENTNTSNKKGGKTSSPGKGKKKGTPTKDSSPKKTGPLPPLEKLILNNIEYTLCNKDRHRSVFVSYDVVVRINVSLPGGDGVGGHPAIRLPFVLTRKTTLNPMSHSGIPEGLFDPPPDPRVNTSKKSSPNEKNAGKSGKSAGKKKGGKS